MSDEQETEADRKLREALERLANNAYGVPPLSVHRRALGFGLKALEGSEHGWQGGELVFYQYAQEGGKNLSRSCAMRVHDIGEVCRLLEVFFKGRMGHADSSSNGEPPPPADALVLWGDLTRELERRGV